MQTTPIGGYPYAEGDDARRDFPAVVSQPLAEALEAFREAFQTGTAWILAGDIGSGSVKTAAVTFPRAFASAPYVLLDTIGNPGGAAFLDLKVGGLTTTGFTARATNPTTGTVTLSADWEISWLAVARGL